MINWRQNCFERKVRAINVCQNDSNVNEFTMNKIDYVKDWSFTYGDHMENFKWGGGGIYFLCLWNL